MNCPSGRIDGTHPLRNLPAALAFDEDDLVLALKVEPEPCAIAEIAPEPDCRIGGDGATTVENVGNAAGWDTEIDREAVGAQASRLYFSPEQASGMNKRRHGLPLVIVDDLDIEGVVVAELKANP